MTDNAKFNADVKNWGERSLVKMLLVAKQSTDDVARIAQTTVAQGGNMPVDTGFLRNSIVATIEGGASNEGNPDAGNNSTTGLDAIQLTIGQLKIGDVLAINWTAEYALARHYMVNTDKGGGLWRDLAADQWQTIVAQNAKRVI
jgi:hypothetical protein